jgi:hypothetical protein
MAQDSIDLDDAECLSRHAGGRESARNRFDLIDQEQLAAQVVAIMNAHFHRPSDDEKREILSLATQQIRAAAQLRHEESLSRARD